MQTSKTTETEARTRRQPAPEPRVRPARRADPLRSLLADAQQRPARLVTRYRVDARGE